MAFVSVGAIFLPQPLIAANTGTGILLNAADQAAWAVHSIRRSGGGSISHIHSRTGTVTTAGTNDLRIETVNSSGNPSGTLWGTTTNGAQAYTTSNTHHRTALTLSATVAMGDLIAVLSQSPSVSFGNLNINRAGTSLPALRGFPYPGGPGLTTKIDITGTPFLLEYSDGVFEYTEYVLPGACNPASLTIATGTNPDEVGNLFTPGVTMRTTGWWMHAGVASGANYRMQLYESGNNTPLATATMLAAYQTSAAARFFHGSWDVNDGVTLTAGTAYRVAYLPTTATSSTIYRITGYNNAFFDPMGLPGAQESSRNRSATTDPDSASWTETSTQRAQMGIIIDAVDDGAGGGAHPGTTFSQGVQRL